MQARLTRRMAGVLSARLPELTLGAVADPRNKRGLRWKSLLPLLNATLAGIVAGCKSFAETEKLTSEMSRPMAKQLGIPRRVPDTTLRDTFVELDPNEIRYRIHDQIHAAHRRHALTPKGLPFGVCAIDGKYTSLEDWDEARTQGKHWDLEWNECYGQQHEHANGNSSSRRVGTMTCSLISSSAKPCIDAIPIPAKTNEMGHFEEVLSNLHAAYGGLGMYRMYSMDAGMCSEANGRLIVCTYQLDYLFGLKDNQPTLRLEAERLLADRTTPDAETEDVVGKHIVKRRLYQSEEIAGYMDWTHLKTVLRVESTKTVIETGDVVAHENRYYLSSLAGDRLNSKQWLHLIRSHWGVENNCHNTWDTAFAEDERPWITSNPKGMINVLLFRRLAYNIVTFFRSVTQRSEEARRTPWKDILRWFYNTLVSATTVDLSQLRKRRKTSAAQLT